MLRCKTLDKIKDKKLKKKKKHIHTQSLKATSAQGASILTRKTKHRGEKKKKIIKNIHTQHSGGGNGHRAAIQCPARGAESRTEQNIVRTHKGGLPKQVWGRI